MQKPRVARLGSARLGFTNRLTRKVKSCDFGHFVNVASRADAWGLGLWAGLGSLHMACCPSARLNLLSIPLMVARDRNSASLTVKCHKFLRLVQFVAALCVSVCGWPTRNKQSDLLSRPRVRARATASELPSRGGIRRCWRSMLKGIQLPLLLLEFQEYGTHTECTYVQVVRQPAMVLAYSASRS